MDSWVNDVVGYLSTDWPFVLLGGLIGIGVAICVKKPVWAKDEYKQQ